MWLFALLWSYVAVCLFGTCCFDCCFCLLVWSFGGLLYYCFVAGLLLIAMTVGVDLFTLYFEF